MYIYFKYVSRISFRCIYFMQHVWIKISPKTHEFFFQENYYLKLCSIQIFTDFILIFIEKTFLYCPLSNRYFTFFNLIFSFVRLNIL